MPVPKSVFAPKLPVPVPSRIETVSLSRFATARSSLPSPLKSPTATEPGPPPVPKSVFAPKLPVPVPSRIETVSLPAFATARSSLPSPLKSPTATELGLTARAEVGLRPKRNGLNRRLWFKQPAQHNHEQAEPQNTRKTDQAGEVLSLHFFDFPFLTIV